MMEHWFTINSGSVRRAPGGLRWPRLQVVEARAQVDCRLFIAIGVLVPLQQHALLQ